MALINYVEPVNLGIVFQGFGSLILFLVMAFCVYRLFNKFIQYIELNYNRLAKYEIIEEVYLDKIALKQGINLDEELIKKKMIQDPKQKSLRKKIEEEIYKDFFEKREKQR